MSKSAIIRSGLFGFLFLVDGVAALAAPQCVPGTTLFGDYDRRGDVSHEDARALRVCLGGPDRRVGSTPPYQSDLCLQAFDADGDSDIDLSDVRKFQSAFTGKCVGLPECRAGTHLEHVNGILGIPDLDSFQPGEVIGREYSCVPDETCAGRSCSRQGSCTIRGGRAVCACKPGYAGDDCGDCDVGFERDERTGDCVLGTTCRERFCSGQGECVQRGFDIACDCDTGASGRFCENGGGGSILRPPTYIEVSGTDASLASGESRPLCATLHGGGSIATNLTWTLEGPGIYTFLPNNCILFVAPPMAPTDLAAMTKVHVCSQAFPDQCADRYLTIDPPGGIKSTGQSHAVLKPFDDLIRRHMWERCIGGAIFGVSLFGKPIMVRGYGKCRALLPTIPDTWHPATTLLTSATPCRDTRFRTHRRCRPTRHFASEASQRALERPCSARS